MSTPGKNDRKVTPDRAGGVTVHLRYRIEQSRNNRPHALVGSLDADTVSVIPHVWPHGNRSIRTVSVF